MSMRMEGLETASREGLSSHLLVQPQELAVAHPTVQDSIHVDVIGLKTQKQANVSGSKSEPPLAPKNLAGSCLTDPSVQRAETSRDLACLLPPPTPHPRARF